MVSINITHVHCPCGDTQPLHSLNALFVHSVEKGRDSQFRLQSSMDTDLADMAPPLISVFWPFNFFLSSFIIKDVACNSCKCIQKLRKELWFTE